METYEIVAAVGSGDWDPEVVGRTNEFPTMEEAEDALDAIAALALRDPEWEGTYAIRAVGTRYPSPATIRVLDRPA